MQRIPDGFKHVIRALENLVIPKPQHAKSLLRQPGIAHSVARGSIVLTSIGFDDQPGAEMHEVDDVGSNGLLTTKLLAKQAMRAQMHPKPKLGVRHAAAELFRKCS